MSREPTTAELLYKYFDPEVVKMFNRNLTRSGRGIQGRTFRGPGGLAKAFRWTETPEGHDFWDTIHDKLFQESCQKITEVVGFEDMKESGDDKKFDGGKPHARLIPLMSIVGVQGGFVKKLATEIYEQEWPGAMRTIELLTGRKVYELAQPALDYGLEKYKEEGSWASVKHGYTRYRDALSRHFIKRYYDGEARDSESELCHNCHIAANLLFLASGYLED